MKKARQPIGCRGALSKFNTVEDKPSETRFGNLGETTILIRLLPVKGFLILGILVKYEFSVICVANCAAVHPKLKFNKIGGGRYDIINGQKTERNGSRKIQISPILQSSYG